MGGMGDFSKKIVLQTYFEGKKLLQGNTCEKNSYNENISFKAYKAGVKNLHRSMPGKNAIIRGLGKIFFTQAKSQNKPPPPPPPSKVKCRPLKYFLVFVNENRQITGTIEENSIKQSLPYADVD